VAPNYDGRMEVTPKTLREVEFREKMRGYHPEDVDHFLEEVAVGVESLLERLRQAIDRAQRAEATASDNGGDDTIRKTLILAQRTADMAVQEAREQASRLLGGAEQQAQAILAEAEERGRRMLDDAVAESRIELTKLESLRVQSQQDVDGLTRWLDEHKAHLQQTLMEALTAVDRAGALWPAPSTRPIDVPPAPIAAPAPMPPPPPEVESNGPDTAMWHPSEDEQVEELEPAGSHRAPPPAANRAAPPPLDMTDGPDDQALDDFFDDNEEFLDDRRFGGRLRRRR
jgi:DivIVA domain-containing protein